MRKSGESFKAKIETSDEIERVLIEIGDFDSVKVRLVKDAGSLFHYLATAEKDGRRAVVEINSLKLNEWARRCERKGEFKSVAHPIKKKLLELLDKI